MMKLVFGILLGVALALSVVSDIGKAQGDALLREERMAKFSSNIEKAKRETSNPCDFDPIRLVQSPDGLNEEAVLVMLGQDVTALTPNINFDAREPVPGEKTVLVAWWPSGTPEWDEIGWLAHGTKACEAGRGKEIKSYAQFHPPFGAGSVRQSWPTP